MACVLEEADRFWRCQKALKERGIEEMLAEARETNAENDGKYLKRSGCKFFQFRDGDGWFWLVGWLADCV